MAKTQRCQGKRRTWRRGVLKDYSCGRKARYLMHLNVGYSETFLVCGDRECTLGLSAGYPAALTELSPRGGKHV